MNPAVEAALVELDQTDGRLRRTMEKTPDDRLLWSPGSAARCILHLVAHCANSLGYIGEMFHGRPYPAQTTEQADAEFLELEETIKTREQAMALWNHKVAAHRHALTSLTQDQLGGLVDLPFALGQVPLIAVLNVGSIHTKEHLAQMDYVQTAYGDRSW